MKNQFFCSLVALSMFGLSGCGSGLSKSTAGSDDGGSTTPAYKKIFVTDVTFLGDFKTLGAGATGIAGADNLCMQNTNHPGSGTYKAMLADGVVRIACTTADCSGGVSEHTNWVLAPNTEYRRLDETTVIGTTTASGIFAFPLDNTVVDGSTPEANGIWTGLDLDWTSHATNCLGFESSSGANSAMAGVSYVDSVNTIQNGGGASCSFGQRLYCVEQ
ncbi:hypothetical protein D3C87_1201380 [compost metagenome]